MSSDNGIYFLKSPKEDGTGFEYRVIHAQVIDNIYYNDKIHKYNDNDNPDPKTLVEYFGDCKPLTKKQANEMASKMYKEIMEDDCPILEYGIVPLETLFHPFSWYIKRAKSQ